MNPVCHICGRSIDTRTETYFQRMEGWGKIRSQGGTNALSNAVRHDLFRCGTCMHTPDRDQLVMFD